MSSGDLFSFLDENGDADDGIIVEDMSVDVIPNLKKRKSPAASRSVSPQPHNGGAVQGNEPGPSTPKKQRAMSPKPVVVDEVEIEAKREVAASAGLMGAVEAGSRLELRHQVS